MVPGIKDGFDRVDCALEASALGLPPARSVDPLPTAVPALPPAPAGVPVARGRATGPDHGGERTPAAPRRREPRAARRCRRGDDLPLAPRLRPGRRPALFPGGERVAGVRALDRCGDDRPLAGAGHTASAREHGRRRRQPARLTGARSDGRRRRDPRLEHVQAAPRTPGRRPGRAAEPAGTPAGAARRAGADAIGARADVPRADVSARRPRSRPEPARGRRWREPSSRTCRAAAPAPAASASSSRPRRFV